MATNEVIQKEIKMLPDYQEAFLKDLLANIYSVEEDPDTGEVSITGIAATSPLFGSPVLDPETGKQFYEGADGTFTTDPELAALDQYGEPILAVEGGVAAPDIIGYTDAQVDALNMARENIGAYQPYLEKAEDAFDSGVTAVEGSYEAYDPSKYKDFYDPFVEDVIDTTLADIRREADLERNRLGSNAIGAGAFGGSRQAVAEQELQRNVADQMAKTGAELRSAAFTGAQQQAQSVFENQMKRMQNAGQLFQGLGTGIGALGEAATSLGQSDVNALYKAGELEQNQLQREYDVRRAAQLEEAYEPFARFSYMRDILSGIPSSGTSLAAAATPQPSPLANVLAGANVYNAATGGQGIFGGLGNKTQG